MIVNVLNAHLIRNALLKLPISIVRFSKIYFFFFQVWAHLIYVWNVWRIKIVLTLFVNNKEILLFCEGINNHCR